MGKKKRRKKARMPTYKSVIDQMKEGDIWYALSAPEQFRRYPKNSDWDMDKMLDMLFNPIYIGIYGHYEIKMDEAFPQRSFQKKPLSVAGIKIASGTEKVTQRKEIRCFFDIPKPSRLPEIMAGIKDFYGPNSFRVLRLVGFNSEYEKVNLDFRNFRPNGLEPNLYCKIIGKKYHCQMSLEEMQEYLGDFYDEPSICKLAPVLKPVCGRK